MQTIIEKIRNLVSDFLITTGRNSFDYNSITNPSKVFTLTEENVDSTSIRVYKNGVLWANTNYSFDSDTVQLSVTGTLVSGDNLLVTFSYYAKYSEIVLRAYIRAALTHLSVRQYKTFTAKSDNIVFPTPDESEENLIAMVASILIDGNVVSYRTPEFTITFGRGESIDSKISKLMKVYKGAIGVFSYIDYGERIAPIENPNA